MHRRHEKSRGGIYLDVREKIMLAIIFKHNLQKKLLIKNAAAIALDSSVLSLQHLVVFLIYHPPQCNFTIHTRMIL
jgi:hypothetical protein